MTLVRSVLVVGAILSFAQVAKGVLSVGNMVTGKIGPALASRETVIGKDPMGPGIKQDYGQLPDPAPKGGRTLGGLTIAVGSGITTVGGVIATAGAVPGPHSPVAIGVGVAVSGIGAVVTAAGLGIAAHEFQNSR